MPLPSDKKDSSLDQRWMHLALDQAQRGVGLTSPNPPVGAVIVAQGKVIGQGYHHKAGEAHAEVEAIRDAKQFHPKLLPGAVIGKNADVAPGSGVIGKVKNGQYWKGSPAVKSGKARHPWPDHRPPRAPWWVAAYGVTSVLLGALPLAAIGAGLAVICWAVRDTATLGDAVLPAAPWVPVAALVAASRISPRLATMRLDEMISALTAGTGTRP